MTRLTVHATVLYLHASHVGTLGRGMLQHAWHALATAIFLCPSVRLPGRIFLLVFFLLILQVALATNQTGTRSANIALDVMSVILFPKLPAHKSIYKSSMPLPALLNSLNCKLRRAEGDMKALGKFLSKFLTGSSNPYQRPRTLTIIKNFQYSISYGRMHIPCTDPCSYYTLNI